MPNSPSNFIVRGSLPVALAAALLEVRCTSTTPEARRDAPVSSPAPVSPAPEPAFQQRIQGRWKVVSSSVKVQDGGVFALLVGQIVSIEGDRLVYSEEWNDARGDPIPHRTTKLLTLLPDTSPQAIDLTQAPDAKGWSRSGIVVLDGDKLFLSLTYTNQSRPTTLEPVNDGREVVTLERSLAR